MGVVVDVGIVKRKIYVYPVYCESAWVFENFRAVVTENAALTLRSRVSVKFRVHVYIRIETKSQKLALHQRNTDALLVAEVLYIFLVRQVTSRA